MTGWFDFRRTPSAADLARFPIIKELLRQQYYPVVYEVWLNQEAPDAEAEIMVDFTGVFDGSGTAAVLYYDSSSANDAAAGVGIRTIRIFGVDEAGTDFQDVIDSMDGTTGTATAEKWTRLNNFKGVTAGANGDAEGTITLQDDAGGTTKHATIAAGNIGAVSARFYFPYGWNAFMAGVEANAYKASHATEGFGDSGDTTISGLLFRPIWTDNTGIANDDIAYYPVTPIESPVMIRDLTPHIAQTEDEECYITLQHVAKEDDNNYTGFYKIWYIAYRTTSAGRGI